MTQAEIDGCKTLLKDGVESQACNNSPNFVDFYDVIFPFFVRKCEKFGIFQCKD